VAYIVLPTVSSRPIGRSSCPGDARYDLPVLAFVTAPCNRQDPPHTAEPKAQEKSIRVRTRSTTSIPIVSTATHYSNHVIVVSVARHICRRKAVPTLFLPHCSEVGRSGRPRAPGDARLIYRSRPRYCPAIAKIHPTPLSPKPEKSIVSATRSTTKQMSRDRPHTRTTLSDVLLLPQTTMSSIWPGPTMCSPHCSGRRSDATWPPEMLV
jgi:hypothetical protein